MLKGNKAHRKKQKHCNTARSNAAFEMYTIQGNENAIVI